MIKLPSIRNLLKVPFSQNSYKSIKFKKMSSQESNFQEVKIPVSYGHLAAKAWGVETHDPVLALHGWQDNAGSFDKLIPLLSSKLYIVALDMPGHGLSSKKPVGGFYHYMEMLVYIQKVVNFFQWDSFSIIGHSMGGTLALLYGSIFPQSVKNIVLLDIIKPASRDAAKLPFVTAEGVQEFIKIEGKMSNPTPVYSLEEARVRWKVGVNNELTDDSIEVMLKRGVQPSSCGKGVVFTRDIRIKVTEDLTKLSHDDLKSYIKRLKCNLLIIIGSDSIIYKSRTPDVIDSFLNIYEEVCKSFQIVEVKGNHFVHLNSPEVVAPHIDSFFQTKCNILSKM